MKFSRKSAGTFRKKIPGGILSEKLVLEKTKVATNPFTTTIQVILNASEILNRENAHKPLFPNYQGQKMTRNGVNNILVKYIRMANKKTPL